jgi:hypothetical protein
MTLHSACWKYHQVPSEDDVFEEWINLHGEKHHTHVGLFNLFDTFVVVKMEVSPAGVWQLISSVPRIQEVTAKSLFQDVKKDIRAEVKRGPFKCENACTMSKIDKSFYHLMDNQRVDLYNPSRDGIGQY